MFRKGILPVLGSDFPLVAMTTGGPPSKIFVQVAGGFLGIYGMKAASQHGLQRDVVFLFHDVWEVCSWEASEDFGDLKVL